MSVVERNMSMVAIYVAPLIAGVIGLLNLLYLYLSRVKNVEILVDGEDGEAVTEEQKLQRSELIRIAKIIQEGARAFLIKEYSYLAVFVVFMGLVVGLVTMDLNTVLSFFIGAMLSAGCGWVGMSIATESNAKTTYTASVKGLDDALKVAFASGAVMGFGVVCSGLLGLAVLYAAIGGLTQEETRYLAGFGFGASSIALFARVGGGIYTKAADVGADLVGKVEAGFDEDSPRNPATIADNVGDNVGDVAGMGADLFESFVGSIIAAVQLSATYALENGDHQPGVYTDEFNQDIRGLIAYPFYIASFGAICSCLGIYTIRTKEKAEFDATNQEDSIKQKNELQEHLLWTIRLGIFITSFMSTLCTLIISIVIFGTSTNTWIKMWTCTFVGLISGVLIGIFTEYATAYTYKPTQTIAKKSVLGPAPVVIQGVGIGMLSTMGPTIILFVAILACYELCGTYGIAIAAVGMLSTLGVTLATDAFGPVADNAGGLAEMAEFPEEVRETTDGLDALGNTTAATGKGFAIGSAVLSALALLSAFKADAGISTVDVSRSEILAGCIWGSCLPFIFAALTMMAVGRAATKMIVEVRRQIKKYDLKNMTIKVQDLKCEYNECVSISTQASVIEMIIPGLLAVVSPLFIGYLLGPEALGGMLVGGITCGFMLAVFMANAGGAWDNAKKYVEAGQLIIDGEVKKKKTEEHKAVVAGDTIGDPFKDTSGPSLNILMKLMTMISLVFAKDQFRGLKPYEKYWVALLIAVFFSVFTVTLTLWMRKNDKMAKEAAFSKLNEEQKGDGGEKAKLNTSEPQQG